jgi:dCTP deaminase
MIWNDRMITAWAQAGGVTPFDEALVNPASLDLRLGATLRQPKLQWYLKPPGISVDKATDAKTLWDEPMEFYDYLLPPGQCVLCHSAEYITMPNNAAGMLASKSSTGRLLLEHFHSGWFDPGFHGQATLELKNDAPWHIRLRPGDLWVQLILVQMAEEPHRNYTVTGRYNGQTGPEAHR